jgi:glyoxylate reductase
MNSLRIFVTREIFPEALALLSPHAEVEVWPEEYPPSPLELQEKSAGVHGLLTNVMDRLDGELLHAAPSLKAISQLSVGLDNVDLAEATRKGIAVGNTPGVLAKATADLGFGLLLDAARRISRGDRWLRAGNWRLAYHPMHWLGAEVHGATLGIFGMGQIGLEMAKRAMGFDMKILYHSRTRRPDLESQYGMEYAERDALLAGADFVSLHLPLTPETRHYIGHDELRSMKSTAVLINMARGPVVDSQALYTALKEGWIQAAGLDVTDPEPISPDDPLLTLENLVISPHIGSASVNSRRATCLMAARNLAAGIQGKRMEHCGNPEVYEVLGI